MPQRKVILAEGELYHVFNRGVARMPIFFVKKDFIRFLELVEYCGFVNAPISYSRFKQLSLDQREHILLTLRKENKRHIDIYALCLMTNHYHFLVKQLTNKGITTWISNVQNGYAKYINIKNQRTGPLFQPRFQALRIETDELALHISRYIHLNPSTDYLVTIDELHQYPWSSFPSYLNAAQETAFSFVNTGVILELSGGRTNYEMFVFDQAEYQRKLAQIKHLTFE